MEERQLSLRELSDYGSVFGRGPEISKIGVSERIKHQFKADVARYHRILVK